MPRPRVFCLTSSNLLGSCYSLSRTFLTLESHLRQKCTSITTLCLFTKRVFFSQNSQQSWVQTSSTLSASSQTLDPVYFCLSATFSVYTGHLLEQIKKRKKNKTNKEHVTAAATDSSRMEGQDLVSTENKYLYKCDHSHECLNVINVVRF